jgi:hypothetical protein
LANGRQSVGGIDAALENKEKSTLEDATAEKELKGGLLLDPNSSAPELRVKDNGIEKEDDKEGEKRTIEAFHDPSGSFLADGLIFQSIDLVESPK